MDRLTEQHRRAQAALRAATVRDLLKLWPALDVTRLDRTYPAWEQAVALLVARNRATSAGLASAYLRAFRAQQVNAEDFLPVLAEAAAAEQVATSLRVTSVVAIKKAMERGVPLTKASRNAFVMSSGEASRLVMDGGRQTITESVQADPATVAWKRVTDGNACEFCKMLAGRGFKYKTEDAPTVFASHAHCGCGAVPVYGNEFKKAREFTPSPRRVRPDGPAVDNNERVAAFQRMLDEASASIRAAR